MWLNIYLTDNFEVYKKMLKHGIIHVPPNKIVDKIRNREKKLKL